MTATRPSWVALGITLWLSLPPAAGAAPPMTTGQAFAEGQGFTGAVDPGAAAKTGGGSVTFGGQTFGIGDITDMNAAQGATGSLNNPPEAALGGAGTLDPTTALGTSAAGQHVTTAFGTRPVFTINPATDPMITGAQIIENNPQAVAGAITTAYSGCSTITSSTPPVYEQKICHESVTRAPQACQKILNVAVKVDWVPSCASGSVIAVSAAGQFCHKKNGLDEWIGKHASAVCDYSNNGFQKIAYRHLPIGEQQFGASGCGSTPRAPNLWLMTGPAYWVPEIPATVPQPMYSYKWGAGTRTVSYVGGCPGNNCSYTIMDEGRWQYTYPVCSSGTTDGAGYLTETNSTAPLPNPVSVAVTDVTPGGCYTSKLPKWSSEGAYCANREIYAYQMDADGNVVGGTCMALQNTRAPDGYTVIGAVNTLNFTRASLVKSVTETDTIDNQCTGLEARAK